METDVQASPKPAPPAAKATPAEEVEFAHVENCRDMQRHVVAGELLFFGSGLLGAC